MRSSTDAVRTSTEAVRGRPGRGVPGGRAAVTVLVCLLGAGCGSGPDDAAAPSTPVVPPITAGTGGPSATAPGAAGPASLARPEVVAEPVAVTIPAIGVRSDLLSLGIAPDGGAEVPADFARAGWFRGGGRPGGRGPTVLLGHVDSTDGPAVFFRLRDLRPGDVIEVTTADGTPARYAVERTEQVAKDAFPTFAVFGATPDDVLRLVTCAGAFDRGVRSYTDNLVVHAVRA